MDVELLDNIIEESTDDLLMQDIVLFSIENNRKLIRLHFNQMILTLSDPSRICNVTGDSREIIIQ